MKIHEYQAKELLKENGVSIQEGLTINEISKLKEVLKKLGQPPWVIKAQIHAGGRGKGGGVKLVNTEQEAETVVKNLLGRALITPQTGPAGRIVRTILIAKSENIKKEMYLGITVDRKAAKPVVIASAEGGVEIEVLAKERPEKLIKEEISPLEGVLPFQARKIAYKMGLDKEFVPDLIKTIAGLSRVFFKYDASLAEINPLVLTTDKKIIALDAKVNFDDNALFRHEEIRKLMDIYEEDERELAAKKFGLSYISLNGTIGCLVNGAGLAMATMDIIKFHGGEPANFLDVGGGATTEAVTEGFKLILSDKKVKAILVNIFGGIVKCDLIADGIINAVKQVELKVPLVVRLEGTNSDIGKKILKNSGLNIIAASNFNEAAEKVVSLKK